MVRVYMESGSHADMVAIFKDEDQYDSCLNALEKLAKEARMFVTEGVDDEIPMPTSFKGMKFKFRIPSNSNSGEEFIALFDDLETLGVCRNALYKLPEYKGAQHFILQAK